MQDNCIPVPVLRAYEVASGQFTKLEACVGLWGSVTAAPNVPWGPRDQPESWRSMWFCHQAGSEPLVNTSSLTFLFALYFSWQLFPTHYQIAFSPQFLGGRQSPSFAPQKKVGVQTCIASKMNNVCAMNQPGSSGFKNQGTFHSGRCYGKHYPALPASCPLSLFFSAKEKPKWQEAACCHPSGC